MMQTVTDCLIGAGGAAAVSVVVVILLVGMLFASPLGILFAGEDTGTEIKIPDAVATLNGEFTDEIYRIMEDHPYDSIMPRAVHTCPDAAVAQPRSMGTAPTLHGQTRCPAISSFTRMTATLGSSAATTA